MCVFFNFFSSCIEDMYVVRESVNLSSESDDDDSLANSEARFHAMIMKVDMKESNFHFVDSCPSELQVVHL